MNREWATDVAQWEIAISAALAWVFVVMYHVLTVRAARRDPDRRAPWWALPMGRHLMAFGAVIAAVTTLSTLIRWLPASVLTSTWFALLNLALLAGVPMVLAHRVALTWRHNHPDRQDG